MYSGEPSYIDLYMKVPEPKYSKILKSFSEKSIFYNQTEKYLYMKISIYDGSPL